MAADGRMSAGPISFYCRSQTWLTAGKKISFRPKETNPVTEGFMSCFVYLNLAVTQSVEKTQIQVDEKALY